MNYQKELEKVIEGLEEPKTLLLHSCCAPCSSYVLVYLSRYFRIIIYFYNPNITDSEEYEKRLMEQREFIATLNGLQETTYPITILEATYKVEDFYEVAKGLESSPEGGERCEACFRLRLEQCARVTKEYGYDYYTTTLTISPMKNSPMLNDIGQEMGRKHGVEFLPSDFKKKNGYGQSVALSKEYDLYRQSYCGCIYSKVQREQEMRV
ncbi:MAG: epoxyqueuosine reductase QueH [Eubacteriales bacterium]